MIAQKMVWLAPALVLGAAVFGFNAGIAAGDGMGDEVRRACGSCHSVERVCALLGERTGAGWKLTVRNMVARGARVSTGNIEPMAAYLGGLEPGDPTVCD